MIERLLYTRYEAVPPDFRHVFETVVEEISVL